MLLDLREIIGVPGGEVPFDYEPDLSDAVFGPVVRIERPPRAAGNVVNRAGVLTFSANVDAVFTAVCARCLKEFEYPVHKRISAYLTEDKETDDPDRYALYGDKADVDEIIITEFVLDLEPRLLCREDCAGLCEKCGLDLNEEDCSCKTETDPRLAVLEQLLDDEEVF